jgi:hypothetical protein
MRSEADVTDALQPVPGVRPWDDCARMNTIVHRLCALSNSSSSVEKQAHFMYLTLRFT